MRTFKLILTAILVFNIFCFLQSCDSADEPVASGEIITDEQVLQQFLDAGFKIAEPEDSIVPQIRFDSNKEAMEYLEEFKKESVSFGLSRGRESEKNIKLEYEEIGAYYYFSYEGINVDIRVKGKRKITNDMVLTESAYCVSISNTPLPIFESESSAEYMCNHVRGYNFLHIVLSEKITVEIKGVTCYQNVDVINYDCEIDFKNMNVYIKKKIRG